MPPLDIEQVLALPADESVSQLLQLPENQWFDRKAGRIDASGLAVTLVAMANAEGGIIAVGLSGGKVDPVTDDLDNKLRRSAADFTNPPIQCSIKEIESSQGRVLIFHVSPSEFVHETHKRECYLRMGDSNKILSFNQRQELEWDKPTSSFEGNTRHLKLKIDDLDEEEIKSFQQRLGSRTPMDALFARELIGDDGYITVAAYLLFASHPQMHFPSAHVRVLQYSDNDRGSGRFLNLIDGADIRFEGSIPNQIDKAQKAIEELIPKRRALSDSGRFESIPTIPKDAWLEGLVNAVVHRSYSDAGDHIRVEIFPNRIEISNPGRFLGANRLDHPELITRKARNPRIARVCHDLGRTQELGEGIRRIFAEMRRVGLSDPIYQQHQNTVNLTLMASSAVPRAILDPLGKNAELILDAMRRVHQPLGTGQIAELVGVSRPTASRNLKKLEAAGLVLWKGDSPMDPRAVWHLS